MVRDRAWRLRARQTPRAAILLAGGAVCLVGCISVGAPPTNFVALEHQWIAALQQRDTAALDRLLDDTFVDTTFRGTVRTKQDVLAGPPAGGPYHSVRLDDVVARPYGKNTVVVTGINVVQGTSADDVVRVRFTDVFVRRHGRWRAVSAQETLQAPP